MKAVIYHTAHDSIKIYSVIHARATRNQDKSMEPITEKTPDLL